MNTLTLKPQELGLNTKTIDDGALIKHEKLTSFKLIIHSLGVTKDNTDLVDIGNLELRVCDREYNITFGTINGRLEDNIMFIDAEIESLDVCKETFDDGKFDLLESDLKSPSLSATVHLSCDEIDGGSVYLVSSELSYGDDVIINVKQDDAIYNNNVEGLTLNFAGDIENESIDLGGILLINNETGHQFQFDTVQSFRSSNEIEIKVQCIREMLLDDHFCIDCPMNLTLSELSSEDLICEFYLGGEFDVQFTKGVLYVNNGVKQIEVNAIEN